MEYPSIIGEDLLDNAENSTWNLLHAYIDENRKILIDEFTRDGVQATPRLKSQC